MQTLRSVRRREKEKNDPCRACVETLQRAFFPVRSSAMTVESARRLQGKRIYQKFRASKDDFLDLLVIAENMSFG